MSPVFPSSTSRTPSAFPMMTPCFPHDDALLDENFVSRSGLIVRPSMKLLALLDFLIGWGMDRAPLVALLKSPYHVLRACVTALKDKSTVLDAMAQWCDDNSHTACGSVDECILQQENVTSVTKGGYIMTIEIKPSLQQVANVLLPSLPVTTALPMKPMKMLQTCLISLELADLICHLIAFSFYNMSSSIYVMEDQVIDVKLISCTALPRVNPLLVSSDKGFKWRTIHNLSSDTTCDHLVLLMEMRNGNSYILDPAFMSLDPIGSYETPYAIFRTDDIELNKWYKHMEFAIDFCPHTSIKVISDYQGVANIFKMVDEKFNSSLLTAFNSPNTPVPIIKRKKKNLEKKLKIVRKSINIQKMVEEELEIEEKQLAANLEKILLDDASAMFT